MYPVVPFKPGQVAMFLKVTVVANHGTRYVLSTRVDLSFPVHKLAKFSANPGKVHFEVLIRLLIYIRDNKTLGLN